jgi:nitrate reductase gamma subunit
MQQAAVDALAAATAEAAEGAAEAVSGATAAAAPSAGWLNGLAYAVMVPMVYAAVLVLAAGIVVRLVQVLRGPAPSFSLRTYPAARRPWLAALGDAFAMPQVRRRTPLFWIFLMIYHLGFLLLILSHLDLLPQVNLVSPESKHMLGAGAAGVAVTASTLYFILRRFRGQNRHISVPADYLLLLLLLFTFLFGDFISWSNSWGPHGFVMTKQDFSAWLGGLARFTFADPRAVLPGSHYHFIVIHVLLANLTMIVMPFTKIMHAFFTLPINALRRR